MVVCSFEVVRKPEYLDSTTCEFSGMFSRFFTWFSANTCGCCSAATVYFVRDIVNPAGSIVSGCAYPGTDWVTVDAEGDGTTVVQEIGHLAELWSHSSDPDNVMTDQGGGTHDQITHHQCCMIRTSRFVRATPPCGLMALRPAELDHLLWRSIGAPFERRERGRTVVEPLHQNGFAGSARSRDAGPLQDAAAPDGGATSQINQDLYQEEVPASSEKAVPTGPGAAR